MTELFTVEWLKKLQNGQYKPLEELIHFDDEASKKLLSVPDLTYNFQDNNIPSFDGITLRSTIEEQYSKIQEELSELTKTNNQERKERLKLQVEINQLKKQLARVRAKAKSYKDELNRREKLDELREDVNSLEDRMHALENEYSFKKDHV